MEIINSRKYEALDLLKIYFSQPGAEFRHTKDWNSFLTLCYKNKNINALMIMRYRLQAGMDDVAKQKLNTEEISVFYLRLMRSVEITARKILREKHKNPNDNPDNKINFTLDTLAAKRKRDAEFADFMHRSAY